MKSKKTIRITIGIVCVCVSLLMAAVLSVTASGGSVPMTEAVVLTGDLQAGEYVTEGKLGVVRIPCEYAETLGDHYTSVQQCLDGDLRVSANVTAGQILTRAMCIGADDPMESFISDDLRLVSFEADTPAEGMTGQISAGDVISVAFAGEDGSYGLDDKLRYLRVYCLSDIEGHTAETMEYLDEHREASEEQGTAQIITVVCTEEQALLLARSANLQVRVIFVGRGPCSAALTAAVPEQVNVQAAETTAGE